MNLLPDDDSFRPWHKIWATKLIYANNNNKMHHALLLAGPEHVGKQHFAKTLSRSLLCQNPRKLNESVFDEVDKSRLSGQPLPSSACGSCQPCLLFDAGTHPDYYELRCPDGKHSIPVDDVRILQDKLLQKSQLSGKKLCVINPADLFNANSANACLKLLEEPPLGTHFLLIAHQLQKVLPTIRSRCALVRFSLPERHALQLFLNNYYKTADVDAAVESARGFPELAIQFIQEGKLEWGFDQEIADLLSGKESATVIAAKCRDVELDDFLTELQRRCCVIDSEQGFVDNSDSANDVEYGDLAVVTAPSVVLTAQMIVALQLRITTARKSLIYHPNKALFLESLLLDCERIIAGSIR